MPREELCPCGSGYLRDLCCADDGIGASAGESSDYVGAAFLARIERATPAERRAIIQQILVGNARLNAEAAFDLIAILRDDGDRTAFAEVVAMLRTLRPALFSANAIYYLDWLIEDALLKGWDGALPALCEQIAHVERSDADIVEYIIDRLAYFGRLSLVVQTISQLAPRHGIGALETRADAFVMLDLWWRSGDVHADDPRVRLALPGSGIIDEQRLRQRIDALMGRYTPRPRPAAQQSLAAWLEQLSFCFLGEATRIEQISPARACLARAALVGYLLDRAHGGLPWVDPHTRRGAAILQLPLVCPDRVTLEYYLAALLELHQPRWCVAAALLELMPAWLRFLERHRVIDAARHRAAIAELHGLADDAVHLWGGMLVGISVLPNIRLAWEEALGA